MTDLTCHMVKTNTHIVKKFPPIEKIIIKKHMKSLNVEFRGQDKNNYDRERALEEVRTRIIVTSQHDFRMPQMIEETKM